jgi:hypothetical protein
MQLMDRLSRLCLPPDRDRLIGSHPDAPTDFAPSSPGLEPEYRRGDGAWPFSGSNTEQVASNCYVRSDGTAIKLVAVMTPETFLLDAKRVGGQRLRHATASHQMDRAAGLVVGFMLPNLHTAPV